MKIIAFYLPQFHCIKENDEWWGEGFTEWINVKKSNPLFKNHNQPRVPLGENYYNLLEVNTHKWQSDLMKQYNIYGLCYYHYWFKGKQLLEQPIEILLENKEIDTKFCMSWANEPWTRSWDGKNKDIIMPQDYGNEDDWIEHFNYLIKFFKDDRYIKVDNKPVFVIYRTTSINECDKMIELWEKLAKKNGLDGIYIVETLNSFQEKPHLVDSNAVIEFEPMFTLRNDMPFYTQSKRFINKKLSKLDKFDYDQVWSRILNRNRIYENKEKFSGAFVDWDNSPRKGEKATVCTDVTVDKFKKNFENLVTKCKKENNDRFIFINAWNEWAEGTYLEPDTKNKYGYLEAIKQICKKND